MVEQLDIKDFMIRSRTVPVIDVRSAGEYFQGNIPGAFNLPLFSDDERIQVGIKYKKSGKDPSVLLGLDIVGPKMADFVRSAKKIARKNEILVHCWRGGKRSESLAWLFDLSGIKTSVLIKGYKAYRNYEQILRLIMQNYDIFQLVNNIHLL